MKFYKKTAISLLLVISLMFSSLNLYAAAPTSWDAPKGGVWTFTKTDGSNPILRPSKITYITYDQLALIQANKLTKSDLQTLVNFIRDYGVKKASEWLAKKIGTKAAQKFVPYLGNAVLAYDLWNAILSYAEDARYAEAIKKKSGVAVSEGITVYAGMTTPYKAIDLWSGGKVSNPDHCIGSFTANWK